MQTHLASFFPCGTVVAGAADDGRGRTVNAGLTGRTGQAAGLASGGLVGAGRTGLGRCQGRRAVEAGWTCHTGCGVRVLSILKQRKFYLFMYNLLKAYSYSPVNCTGSPQGFHKIKSGGS